MASPFDVDVTRREVIEASAILSFLGGHPLPLWPGTASRLRTQLRRFSPAAHGINSVTLSRPRVATWPEKEPRAERSIAARATGC